MTITDSPTGATTIATEVDLAGLPVPPEGASAEEWEAYSKRLATEAFRARTASCHNLERMPWEEAFRHLTELTIQAIKVGRLEGGECEPLVEMEVTLCGLHGAFHVATTRQEGPTEFLISNDQPVWDAWTCLATAMRGHTLTGMQRERDCICR